MDRVSNAHCRLYSTFLKSCNSHLFLCQVFCSSHFVHIDMQEFKNFTSLTELGLSDNNISTLPPELVSIREPLAIELILYVVTLTDYKF